MFGLVSQATASSPLMIDGKEVMSKSKWNSLPKVKAVEVDPIAPSDPNCKMATNVKRLAIVDDDVFDKLHEAKPNDFGDKLVSRYVEMIGSLSDKEWATMEASVNGDQDNPIKTFMIHSLVAPDKLAVLFKETILSLIPTDIAKDKFANFGVGILKALAKISGIKINEPEATHYKKRPTLESIHATVAKDYGINVAQVV